MGGSEYNTFSFFFKHNELSWSKKLGTEGSERDEALFPIDRLIAPEAACPGPLAKSIIFVAKVRLGRFPIPFLVLNKKAQQG